MKIEELDYHDPIEGTTLFDGEMAMKGYALNKMCYSFNKAENREEYLSDPEAYMEKFKLSEEQRQACRERDVLKMIAAGGNIYYLAKLAGIHKLDVQDVGAQQTGMTKEEFKARLKRAGE